MGERRERGVGEREKEDKRLQQSREILSMDTGPFHSNIHGIQPFQLNKYFFNSYSYSFSSNRFSESIGEDEAKSCT